MHVMFQILLDLTQARWLDADNTVHELWNLLASNRPESGIPDAEGLERVPFDLSPDSRAHTSLNIIKALICAESGRLGEAERCFLMVCRQGFPIICS
jgi:hypothetical protein